MSEIIGEAFPRSIEMMREITLRENELGVVELIDMLIKSLELLKEEYLQAMERLKEVK